ncbi:MAG: TetR/AcrR family transcriptional regulator [Bacteroidales bacterium]|nr:TetR/AcrR family transcriptional regulator [Bacteroidales bacterium]MDD3200664.1 TetR/AcrR family transcriptional regulator [Bacteroidales bacterium]
MTVKEKIMDNTVNFFLKEGCRKVTMDEIAAYNGMSKRTLYENFTDKNDLIRQCVLYSNELEKSSYLSNIASQEDMMDILLRGHERNFSIDLSSMISFMDEVRKYFPDIYRQTIREVKEAHCTMMAELLTKGQTEGYFIKNLDARIIAPILSEIMKIAAHSELTQGREMSQSETYKMLVLIYFRGLTTEKGRKIIDEFMKNNN